MTRFVFLSFVLVISTGLLAQPGEKNRVEKEVSVNAVVPAGETANRQSLSERMQFHKVNGVSIAVIHNGIIEWADGYGINDATNPSDKVTSETLFQCASIGKVVTAMAVLHLVKEKKLSLDDAVNTKLLGWKIPENDFTAQKKITVRHLLSHSAGLTDDYGFDGYEPGNSLPSLLQILNAEKPANNKKKLAPAAVPGTTERYSGGGYIILQQLVEDITGQSFARFVDSVVFKPLGMNRSVYAFYPDKDLSLPIARGHYENGKADKKLKYYVYPEFAAAGFWTTPTDLCRLVLEIQREHRGASSLIADSSLVRQMLKPQINSTGLGIHLKGAGQVTAFWHSGNTSGYTGLFFGTVAAGDGAVVLTNSNGGEWLALELIRSIADVYNWPAMQTKPAMALTAEEISLYPGQYSNGKGFEMGIKEEKGNLHMVIGKQQYRLYKLQDGGFIMKEKPDGLSLVFTKNEQGAVTSVMLEQNAGNTSARLDKVTK